MVGVANVINVSLAALAALATRDNMNLCAVFTGLQDGPLSTAERFRTYIDAASVADDWGSSHEITQHANVFFSQSPNPVNADGRFIAAYHRATSESVAATAAVLTGGQVDVNQLIADLQQISDGKFDIDVDASTINITGMDFQSVTSIDDVVALLDDEVTGITGATVTFDTGLGAFIVTSDTTGVTSTLSFATDPGGAGTYVGALLALEDGSGAAIVQGAAADVLSPETKVDALTAVQAEIAFKGFMFIAAPSGSDVSDIATWAQANDVLGYEVYSDPDELEPDPSENPWAVKLAGQSNYRGLFRNDNNRKFATGYMARAHVVNFSAVNSVLTMQLKEIISIVAEAFSQTNVDKAKTVGLDIYTTIKNTPVLLTSGANRFTDERYILLAFIDAVATDLFNTLKAVPTKVPQTVDGTNQMVDTTEGTSEQFVTAGAFAPGTWTSQIPFGDEDTFRRNIEDNGFYVLIGRLSDQPASEREERKSPVMQVAVKGSGAIHSQDVVINFNP